MATSLSLAALSPRPALFAPLIPVMIHKMALALDDEAQAGRLEVRESFNLSSNIVLTRLSLKGFALATRTTVQGRAPRAPAAHGCRCTSPLAVFSQVKHSHSRAPLPAVLLQRDDA